MTRMRFLKYGKWIVGGVATAAISGVVTHCSTSQWTPTKPTTVPDNYSKWDYNWDKREPYSLVKPPKPNPSTSGGESKGEEDVMEQLKKKKATAIRHLILIRHGQYNMDGETDADRILSPLGEEQAQLTGVRLKNSGINFDSIISSDMTRACQTTEIILKEMDRKDLCWETKDPLLREGRPCRPEPPSSSFRPDLWYYEDGPRIEAAFRKYFHRADPTQEKDSYEVIVCHANVIRYFACRALQLPGEAWLRISLKNCSLTIISILPSGRVVLRALGDSGHLPAAKVTTS